MEKRKALTSQQTLAKELEASESGSQSPQITSNTTTSLTKEVLLAITFYVGKEYRQRANQDTKATLTGRVLKKKVI